MNRREAIKQSSLILGYSISATSISQIWASCKAKTELDWTPTFFTKEQARTIIELAECILPVTDTPGARGIGLDKFIDMMVNETFSPDDQKTLIAEMQQFDKSCEESTGEKFAYASRAVQDGFVLQQEELAGTYNHRIWGEVVGTQQPVTFYRKIKSLAIMGYFTSEEVGKNLLTYDPIPGTQAGCIPLSEVGNTYFE